MGKKKKHAPIHTKKNSRIFLPVGIALLALFISSQVVYTQGFRSDVLGDEDKSQEDQQKETEKQQEEQQKEEEKRQEDEQKQDEQSRSGSSQNIQPKETEIETKEGVKIKTKVEDNGAAKIEIESEKIHFKFEEKDGEVKLRVEDGEGVEVRTRERVRELAELEQELEDEDISVSSEDGRMEIEHNAVRTRTNFPLSMDPITRELIVTTPNGEKTLAIMPDEALKNLFTEGVLTDASTSAALASALELKVVNGNLVYEVEGKKKQNLLGIVPVTIPRTVTVSALSGEVLSQTQSVLSSILSFFSF